MTDKQTDKKERMYEKHYKQETFGKRFMQNRQLESTDRQADSQKERKCKLCLTR